MGWRVCLGLAMSVCMYMLGDDGDLDGGWGLGITMKLCGQEGDGFVYEF